MGELDEVPTDLLQMGEQRFMQRWQVNNKNGVYFLSASNPSEKSICGNGIRCCAPLVNAGNGKLYICNQFAGHSVRVG